MKLYEFYHTIMHSKLWERMSLLSISSSSYVPTNNIYIFILKINKNKKKSSFPLKTALASFVHLLAYAEM